MKAETERKRELLSAARGDSPCDLVLKNGRIINTFTMEVLEGDVGIRNGFIAGVGDYDGIVEMDLEGAFVSPGFIESHFHVESSMLRPSQLARLVVPRGTTRMVADPHEIANVAGVPGIEFLLKDSLDIPLDLLLMAPSCVPATRFETAGARVTARDIRRLFRDPRVIGLGEVMSFPAVVEGKAGILGKMEAARGRPIDGHAPMLSGKDLCAYIAAGPRSDHECASAEEALEKARLGMWVMIRGESGNVRKLAAVVSERNCGRFMLVSDDRPPDRLFSEGHLDHLLREAVRAGVDPVLAVRLVTLNPAQYFGFPSMGAVAPGYAADLAVIGDLESFEVRKVFRSGRLVAEDGVLTAGIGLSPPDPFIVDTVRLPGLREEDLRIRFKNPSPRARIMELVNGTILTLAGVEPVSVDAERFFSFYPGIDLAPVCVLERHGGTGNIGKGLVRGFGLKRGALASTFAHDSHNVICLFADPRSALTAIDALRRTGGGLCAALGDQVIAQAGLEIAGLIHQGPMEGLLKSLRDVEEAAAGTGCAVDHPFFYLSFLSLAVVPELRVTDRGLFDVRRFRPAKLEVE